MKLVLLMGGVWKFSRNSWKNFLAVWKNTGEMPNISKYATHVTEAAPNITDWDIDDVVEAIRECNKSK